MLMTHPSSKDRFKLFVIVTESSSSSSFYGASFFGRHGNGFLQLCYYYSMLNGNVRLTMK